MKPEVKKASRKGHAHGGVQALGLGPSGVTEKDSPVINALKQKRAQGKANRHA